MYHTYSHNNSDAPKMAQHRRSNNVWMQENKLPKRQGEKIWHFRGQGN